MKKLLALIAMVAMIAVSSVAFADDVEVEASVSSSVSFDTASGTCDDGNMTLSISPSSGNNAMDDKSCTLVVDATGSPYDLQIDETGTATTAGEGNAVEETGMCSVETGNDVLAAGTCANYSIADIADGAAMTAASDFPDTGAFGLYIPGTTGVSGATTYSCTANTTGNTCKLDDGNLIADEEPQGYDELWTLHVAIGGGGGLNAASYADKMSVTVSQD